MWMAILVLYKTTKMMTFDDIMKGTIANMSLSANNYVVKLNFCRSYKQNYNNRSELPRYTRACIDRVVEENTTKTIITYN